MRPFGQSVLKRSLRDGFKSVVEAIQADKSQAKIVFWTRLGVLLAIPNLIIYAITYFEVKKSADAATTAANAAKEQTQLFRQELQELQGANLDMNPNHQSPGMTLDWVAFMLYNVGHVAAKGLTSGSLHRWYIQIMG